MKTSMNMRSEADMVTESLRHDSRLSMLIHDCQLTQCQRRRHLGAKSKISLFCPEKNIVLQQKCI